MNSCTKPRLQPKMQKRHTSVAQRPSSRQDTETTRCYFDKKRQKMGLNTVSTT